MILHRWLGIGIGLIWVLLGLTGSINVFRWDIDEWLNPELVVDSSGDMPIPLEQVYRNLTFAFPERQGSWSLEMPRHRSGMLMARHFARPEREDGKLIFVSVNPFTGAIVAQRDYASNDFFVTWIYQLHSTLFLGDAGTKTVGIAGLMFLVSLGSGIYLWWPKSGKLGSALTVKRSASGPRLIYDWHKVSGVYGLVMLCAVSFSGTCLIFWDFVEPAVTFFSPVNGGFNPQPEPPNELHSVKINDRATPITLDSAVGIALKVFPNATLRFVKTPDSDDGIYSVQLRQPNEASQFFTTTSVWVDQYDGEILAKRDPSRFNWGERFLNALWPIHNGEIFGTTGRILVLVTGLLPSILFITGIIRWRQKAKAKRMQRR